MFDLVLVDTHYAAGMALLGKQVGWTKGLSTARDFDVRRTKLRFLNASLAGLVAQEHRLDFELYDHATQLATAQLVHHGLISKEPVTTTPSMIATLQAAGALGELPTTTLRAWSSVAERRETAEGWRHYAKKAPYNRSVSSLPPVCQAMVARWRENGDERPANTGGGAAGKLLGRPGSDGVWRSQVWAWAALTLHSTPGRYTRGAACDLSRMCALYLLPPTGYKE
eukprot:CAMPEP_0181235800 /NCGR_PEP_ID=MMETSP1096-20121128/37788_1 /TAXON_ID=156174 ORGANISM="Chrysochromulina ericina, Strain CCMP281" /NCGR_SAMPLE_ID=MMETSP1096 /ASSEMBLY_ACC=CAM_ASM_000453 /LENGTH=224 /DNA_ID=CAMNT_0023330843 /DNA_START=49 /DNA_END=724 /DNA_ORIENTATION=+